jgi:16S rRNA (guanine(527)-N(7))-methyltransferase RsmG
MSGGSEPLLSEEFRKLLDRELPRWGLSPPEDGRDRLSRFLAELDHWRRSINLTGRLTSEELVAHALESVLGERFLPDRARVVDIGTGAGFPGVPLSLWRPDLEMVWLEPRERRAAFLRHVARILPVENARVVVGRQEGLPKDSFRYATSRAVKIHPHAIGKVDFLEPGGALVLWTTATARLAPGIEASRLIFEDWLPIPASRQRKIAVFRKI